MTALVSMRLRSNINESRCRDGVQHSSVPADTLSVSCRAVELRLLGYFVAVAEERHVGRAAVRLHMTQPPLSRAIKQLEAELGAVLLHRSSTGVTLTAAGVVLYDEARTLLEQSELVRSRVAAVAGAGSITLGVLADSAEQAGSRFAAAFGQRHPGIAVTIREADFADPTAGLRAGVVDVALTRTPFDDTGISTRVLRVDPVGVVLQVDDPLAGRETVHLHELADRPWFQLPEGTDPVCRAYGNCTGPDVRLRHGPVVRTMHECLQAVLWNGTVGLSLLAHPLPEGLTIVALADKPPSRLVVAWNSANRDPLVRSVAEIAAALF